MLEINGDITDPKLIQAGYIIQQVNCQGASGAGVSGAIDRRWPAVTQAYYHKIATEGAGEAVFGDLQYVPVSKTLTVVNSFTQLDYGNARKTRRCYTDLARLSRNLFTLASKADETNTNVYLPKFIGCGLAGGNWITLCDLLKDCPRLIAVNYQP